MNDNKSTQNSYSSLKGIHRAIPIILFGVAVFCLLCFIISDIGDFGRAIRSLFFGLFANGAYFIPLFICLHAIFYPADLADKKIVSRLVFSFVSLIMISSFCYAIAYWNADVVFNISDFYNLGKAGVGGGAIGGTIAYVTVKIFGKVGVIIIALTILAIYISYFFASGKKTWSNVFYTILKAIVISCAFVEKIIKKLIKRIKSRIQKKKEEKHNKINRELSDDEFFDVDNGMQSISIDKLGISQSKIIDGQTVTLHDKVFHKSAIPADEYFSAEAESKSSNNPNNEATQKQFTSKKRIIHTDFDMGGDFLRSSTSETAKNDKADIIIEDVEEPMAKSSHAFSYEKSADDVFTKDFDPFQMMMSDDLATKPSSKVTTQGRVIQGFTYSEKLNDLTEENVERAKRVQEFEARKQMIINQTKQATPVNNNGEYSGVTKSVEFKESTEPAVVSDTAKEGSSSISMKIDKNSIEQEYYKHRVAPSYETDKSDIGYHGNYSGASGSNTFSSKSYQTSQVNEPNRVVDATPEYKKTDDYRTSQRANDYTPSGSAVSQSYTYGGNVSKIEPTIPYTPKSNLTSEPSIANTNTLFKNSADGLVFEFGSDENDTEIASGAESLFDDEYREEVTEISIEGESDDDAPLGYMAHTESIDIERTIITDNEEEEPQFDESEAFDSFTDDADEDEYADNDELTEQEELCEEEISEDTQYEPVEIPEEEQNEEVKGYRNMFNFLKSEDENRDTANEEPVNHDSANADNADDIDGYSVTGEQKYTENEEVDSYADIAHGDGYAVDDDDIPPFDTDDVKKSGNSNMASASSYSAPSQIADLVKEEEHEEPKKKKKPDYSNFRFPPIDLLGLEEELDDDEIAEEIKENTKILIETLQSFNVTASIKGVDRGPRITRYEVVPAKGVKVNQITHLFDDIALNLAAEGIRMEAPIPGKSAIGFEIPNKRSSNVRLRELLECEKFINAESTTFVCIGKDVAGTPVFADIEKFPHCLVAGATGMGKSVCINSILISLLYKARPDEVKFIMIDPKKVEFKMYSGIPHLLIPVITDAKQAAGALMWAVEEMERRYDLIESSNVRNLAMYNERVEENPGMGEKLPKIIIVIDELNDLMMQVREPCEDLIMRIAQKARAAGIHLIIGTQRPDAKVITGTIKANINTRIACKVGSQIDSRTILDNKGAEKLLNKGDMLYKPVDKTKPIRVQGAFVSDSEVEAIMSFLKAEDYGEQYDSDVLSEITKAAQKCGNKKSQSAAYDDDGYEDEEIGYYNDQKFLDAVELAIRSGKISTSLLQRKLSIGYGKAAKYIDAMEEIGVVSEPNGPKPREVLISMDEWHEKLSRVGFDD